MGRFGKGQALRRVEDDRFLSGAGCYTADIARPGECHLVFVRSPHAHAEIVAVDITDAIGAPGVLAIYTAGDLSAAGIGDIPCIATVKGKDGAQTIQPPHPVLARGRVRHVGDPVAAIVAESLAEARDASELINVSYRELPAVVDPSEALSAQSPQIWAEAPGNLCVHWVQGDEAATATEFAKAAQVVRQRLTNNRVVVNAMEPRAALGEYDRETGRFTLTTPSQGVSRLRDWIAEHVFGLPKERFRVVSPDVGGGFGMKIFIYAEQVMTLFAAQRLDRPVRWVGDRTEGFLSDSQGRDQIAEAELALDAEGRFLALRLNTVANLGAYLSNFAPIIPTVVSTNMLSGLYAIPAISASVKCAFTNTVPVDAYRGAGRPEAAYIVERLIDAAGRQIGLGPVEIRRRNLIMPDALPYKTATGVTYDSGHFAAIMDKALSEADWTGIDARKASSRQAGWLRGIGLATYIEACAGIGAENARLVLDGRGGLDLYVGTLSNGQGHATAYTQILVDRLGLAPEAIRVHQGDSDWLPMGGGTGGSRSLLMGHGAIEAASVKLLERCKEIAASLLEAAPGDLEFADGRFRIVGTDRTLSLGEIAAAAAAGKGLPENLTGAIDEIGDYTAPGMTYPYGCHICEVEIEEATGQCRVVSYRVVDDFGTVINPLLVRGQVLGGIAQGLGQALLEHTIYDRNGQLLTGSFMDYCLPRADDTPPITVTLIEDYPCKTNPLGVKGAGEAGAIGAPPALMNAIVDALSPLGIDRVDMPATPERLWRLIEASGKGRPAA